MKRRRLYSQPRLGRDAERLVWLAQGLADSGSRAEDAYWEGELSTIVIRLLGKGEEEVLNQALDRLHETNARAYDELADLIEAHAEAGLLETPEGPRQVLMIAMPVLAWSRYGIPAGKLSAAVLANLRAQLGAHVLAEGAQLALADCLYSPDQVPRGFVDTRRFAERLWQLAVAGQDLVVPADQLPESGFYVSDVRYLLGAVAVTPGRPIFRWNEPDGGRDSALEQWRGQGGPGLQSALLGSAFELLQPDAYFAAWRRADREGRGYALTAAVAYLQAVLNLKAGQLRAVVAPYYDLRLVEWRVGFARTGSEEVLHGVVWPLLGTEEDGGEIGAEIVRLLQGAGVGEVLLLEQHMPLEYCDDCGSPLFPNADEDSVHAEMPEQDSTAPVQLH